MKPLNTLYQKMNNHPWQGFDPILLVITALLCLGGVLLIYTASSSLADRMFGSSLIFLRNHLIHLVVGLIAMAITMRIPYSFWKNWAPLGLALCLVLLILVVIPGVGHQVGGARRWLRLGFFNFQPTEFLKLAMVVHVAYFLDRKQDVVSQFKRGLAPTLAVMGLFLGLVLLQPDFGTVVLIALTVMLMLFVGGGKPGHILIGMAGFALVGAYLVVSQSYRMKRMLAFLDPWQDRLDTGFQIVQSYLALGNGGWFGVGLGDSRQKMFFLPEAHTDFIFSILGEELGLVGSLTVMALLIGFIWRGFSACLTVDDDFGRYLAFGITAMLGLQTIINLGVVMGLMPTKGLPLPFLSYGGSSLVMTLIMTGILLNVGKNSVGNSNVNGL